METDRLTPIGKFLRKLRIDRDERMLDMGRRLGISAAFLSAVEMGRKAPPSDFGRMVAETYNLTTQQTEELISAEAASRKHIKLMPRSSDARVTVALLARHINDLGAEELMKIRKIAEQGGKTTKETKH